MTSAVERLFEEEEDELRAIGPAESAFGKNGSDYLRMSELCQRLFDDAATIRSNPRAFIVDGHYNDKVINAYSKLMSLVLKGRADLSRMRNQDKMVDRILNENTRDLSQAVSIELGAEVKSIIQAIDAGSDSDEVIILLKRLMYQRIPQIFLKSAKETLESTREEYGLKLQ